MGNAAMHTVLGRPAPAVFVERNRRDGVFGVVSRRSYREGRRSDTLLGIAHSGAAGHDWLGLVLDGSKRRVNPYGLGSGAPRGARLDSARVRRLEDIISTIP
jgi:hypothetical protein